MWVVFCLRPQLQWIPSAWKQWGLKEGVSLRDFVCQCIDTRTPSFNAAIESWKSALPAAQIHVRFLIPELQTGGNSPQDFFHLLGVSQANFEIEDEPRNPSLDVSVLHVLSKNPHLFSDVEARIEECFRDENHLLSNTYYGGTDVDRIHP